MSKPPKIIILGDSRSRSPSGSTTKYRITDLPNPPLTFSSTKCKVIMLTDLIHSDSDSQSPWASSSTTIDRISDLPDPILSHILSFLPTKLTVATSILSKRWKTIYQYVPSYDMYTPFIAPNHLWSALQCRDIKLPIPLFRLFCHQPEVSDPLIIAATQRGVETLELTMLASVLENDCLSNILTCKTLTVLKLSRVYIGRDIPQINTCPIKTLHLEKVTFFHFTYMINFFLAFSMLEELQTDNLLPIIPEKRRMIQCFPNLVRANISDIQLIPLICLSRALFLNVNKVPLISIVQLPVFYNLTRLELYFNFEQSWLEKWNWILKLLQQSHKLQHLIIHEEIQNEINDENWQEPQTVVAECLSSQLRTCLFRNYRGRSAELQFAEYVMRHSKVLLIMTIRISSSIDLNTKFQILQKLSLCPRSCKLVFD